MAAIDYRKREIRAKLGNNLTRVIRDSGLTVEEAAERLDVDRTTVIRRCQRGFDILEAGEVAAALGCGISDLLMDTGVEMTSGSLGEEVESTPLARLKRFIGIVAADRANLVGSKRPESLYPGVIHDLSDHLGLVCLYEQYPGDFEELLGICPVLSEASSVDEYKRRVEQIRRKEKDIRELAGVALKEYRDRGEIAGHYVSSI